ncbi:MAG: lysophospholipase [Lentisphaerales bacterium]|nr:lysophospholipase [Lentisphaerales bacterium]
MSPAFKPIATHMPGFINHFRYRIEQKFLEKCWSACLGKSPFFAKTVLRSALKVNPPVDSGRAGDAISDLEEVNNLFKHDPMIGKLIYLRFLHSILKSMTEVITKAEKFPKPFLLIYGSHDKIVNSEGSKEFFSLNQKSRQVFSASKQICYENFFPHELHNSSKKDQVMQHISNWIKALVTSDSQ